MADVAVIGIPDAKAGELPKAYVVVKPGQVLTELQVKRFVAGDLILWLMIFSCHFPFIPSLIHPHI